MKYAFPGLIVIVAMSCSKLIQSAINPIFDCLTTAVQNKELQNLQSNLMTYWLTNKENWPNDSSALVKFSDSIGSPISQDFRRLVISNLVDSVFIDYQLFYKKGDSIRYKDISGNVSMRLGNDSVKIRHQNTRIEMLDGTI